MSESVSQSRILDGDEALQGGLSSWPKALTFRYFENGLAPALLSDFLFHIEAVEHVLVKPGMLAVGDGLQEVTLPDPLSAAVERNAVGESCAGVMGADHHSAHQ